MLYCPWRAPHVYKLSNHQPAQSTEEQIKLPTIRTQRTCPLYYFNCTRRQKKLLYCSAYFMKQIVLIEFNKINKYIYIYLLMYHQIVDHLIIIKW